MRQNVLQQSVDRPLEKIFSAHDLSLARFIAEHYSMGTAHEAISTCLIWTARDIMEEKEEEELSDQDYEIQEILAEYEDV